MLFPSSSPIPCTCRLLVESPNISPRFCLGMVAQVFFCSAVGTFFDQTSASVWTSIGEGEIVREKNLAQDVNLRYPGYDMYIF